MLTTFWILVPMANLDHEIIGTKKLARFETTLGLLTHFLNDIMIFFFNLIFNEDKIRTVDFCIDTTGHVRTPQIHQLIPYNLLFQNPNLK